MDNNIQNNGPQNFNQMNSGPQNFNNQTYSTPPQMNNKPPKSGLSIAALILSILGCTFLIGAILAIIDLAKKDGKNKILSKIALGICGFWVLIGVIGNLGNKNDSNDVSTVTTEVTTEITAEETTETTTEVSEEEMTETATESSEEEEVEPDYTITVDETGEFGKVITLNANTDMPVDKYLYKLPAGDYRVTTSNPKATQFSIVKDEIGIEDGNDDYPEILQYVGDAYLLTAGDDDMNGHAKQEVYITLGEDESISVPGDYKYTVQLYFFSQK